MSADPYDTPLQPNDCANPAWLWPAFIVLLFVLVAAIAGGFWFYTSAVHAERMARDQAMRAESMAYEAERAREQAVEERQLAEARAEESRARSE